MCTYEHERWLNKKITCADFSTGCLSKNQQVFPLFDETLGYSVQQYVLRQDVFESQALSFSDATTQ